MTRLSICMVTRNRAGFIGETLDSILPQLTPDIELLVVDGASTDSTPEVIARYQRNYPALRYYREETNSGIDGDYDKAVGYARGDYCWLMPDDDLLKPGAVARVFELLSEEPELVLVDAEVRDVKFERLLVPRRLSFSGVRRYGPGDADRFMVDAGEILSFIGCTVVRRSFWEARDRKRHYGSFFVHVGVVFEAPPRSAIICGETLMSIRYGNSMWTPRRFEIWAFSWPKLIYEARGYSDEAKRALMPRPPWRDLKQMISFRARGAYGRREYRQFLSKRRLGAMRPILSLMALVPGKPLHILATLLFVMRRQIWAPGSYELVRCSPYSNAASRWIARKAGLVDASP
ncbi:glycosyltransferase family 2 protein [Sphingomonas lutea]|uniref:Glycosyltransferase family 2 protein n=1 Tax=Sphingomonas lutea TaxID=1045317 RepID=A0A7G9SEW5_9SPHN|nr:glycosyltransferase family 2 protein [Sphingomonas lutea]QNN66390.1 glycosyltransferase family 2 protein [Sphingomonas lutea]